MVILEKSADHASDSYGILKPEGSVRLDLLDKNERILVKYRISVIYIREKLKK